MMRSPRRECWLLGAAFTLAFATPALAVDGVVEINQSCAVAGCFSGDLPGFPVTITQPGSYRLTSNLSVSGSVQAIDSPIGSAVSDVTLDLNGFTIAGAGLNNGIQLWDGDHWEIRNGTVRNFNNGIQQGAVSSGHRIIGVRLVGNANQGILMSSGEGDLVQGCTASGNGSTGITVAPNSRVVGNTAVGNGGFGLELQTGSAYSDNVINDNSGGTVSGGVEMGPNVCDGDNTCP